jgi:Ca2+/Na+ antiporter
MADSFVFFSILALIVAIYKILPRKDIIEIKASLSNLMIFLSVMIVVCVLCLIVLSTALGFLEILVQIFSIIIFFVCLIIFLRRGTVRNTSKFIEDLDELYNQGNAFLFFKLVDSHYQFLIVDPFPENMNLDQNKDQELLNPFPIRKKEIYMPNEEIQTYIRGKFLDPNFILKMALINPYLGVRISLDEKVHLNFRQLLIFKFYRYLLKHPESVLHNEILGCNNFSEGSCCRYSIPTESKIISEIISNLEMAKNIGVIRAFGETTIELIREEFADSRDRKGSFGIDNSTETEPNPLLSGIRIFDLFVREGLYQKIPWHMELYYHYHFIKEICARSQMSLDPEEYYTRYDYPDVRYMEDILYNLINWIRIADEEPDKIDLSITDYGIGHENGNIIKSSIVCLSQCIHCIILSKTVPSCLKERYMHDYLRLCFELRGSKKEISNKLANTMAECLVHGSFSEDKGKMNHLLNSYIKTFDQLSLVPHNKDGERLLKKLLECTASKMS